MKQLFKLFLGGMLMMAMPLMMTSCEGTLDDIFGEWSRPGSQPTKEEVLDNLSSALEEGALVTITYTIDGERAADGKITFSNAKVYLENGQPIDPDKVYTVSINSYMAKWAQGRCVSMEQTEYTANDAEILYLKDHQMVDYKGVSRYTLNKKF